MYLNAISLIKFVCEVQIVYRANHQNNSVSLNFETSSMLVAYKNNKLHLKNILIN